MKRLLALTLATVMLLALLCGCGDSPANAGDEMTGESGEDIIYIQQSDQDAPADEEDVIYIRQSAAPAEAETFALTDGEGSVTSESGVTVDVGGYALRGDTLRGDTLRGDTLRGDTLRGDAPGGEETLTVQPQAAEENAEEGYKIEAYDIAIGDKAGLDDFITIRIPYGEDFCEPGQDPARCVGAKYKNSGGEWEDVLYEVDAANKELVIYTDHLSVYGAFYIKNEGMRNAYIADVYSLMADISQDTAAEAMRELAAGGPGEAVCSAGAEVANSLFEFSDTAGSIGEGATSVLNLASLGYPVFDSVLATKAADMLEDLGTVAAAVKFTSLIIAGGEATDKQIASLYKDVAGILLNRAGGAAVGGAMAGVWVLDQGVTAMFEAGMEIKLENIGMVYQYYNNEYASNSYKARSLKDWRNVLIDIAEANPGGEKAAQKALEKEIDRYAKAFWDIDADVMAEVASELGLNYKRMSYPTKSDIKELTKQYKLDLYNRLYPVATSAANYMAKKAEAEYLKALNKTKAFYNQTLRFTATEQVEDGGQSKYAGYTLRFSPLSATANAQSWTGTMNDTGSASTKFTLLGFMQAGCPNIIDLYAPGADPAASQPELSVPFKLTAPATEASIGGGLSLAEI